MQCFSPLTAWRLADGGISFVERGKNLVGEVRLRCGQCIGCRLNRANAWAVRCVHEAQMHEFNSFITLTYDEAHLPMHGSLHYPDFQAFMRRMRKRLKVPIRFFMCGEYGEQFDRPHYHALLFGVGFTDLRQSNSVYADRPIYRSPILESLWPFGMSTVGEVNLATAQYCAQYSVKKITGDKAHDHYSRVDPATGEIVQVVPEFGRMSLKPGIGATWLAKFAPDVFNWDNVVINGKVLPVPKYYDKVLTESHGKEFGEMEYGRQMRERDPHESSDERLAVKAVVAKARLNHYRQRSI